MTGPVLLDTGPLVSFLSAEQEHSDWVLAEWKRLRPPLLTCEPVLTETAFLLGRGGADAEPLFELLERRIIRVAVGIEDQLPDLRALMKRYRNRPMSLADACLVRLSELHPRSIVFTLDRDFLIYRRHGNRVIPVLMPEHEA
jgi:predicted nucleic acid-binding protein